MQKWTVSWTDIYPFLSDDMVDTYQAEATPGYREMMDGWFGVAKVFNRKDSDHVVVTTLCRRPEKGGSSASHNPGRNDSPYGGDWLGWFEFQRLLEGAAELRANKPSVVLRVYLAADLEDWVGELTGAGCEVFLMKASSKLEHAVSMWKFLALDEKRWITFTDASFGWEMTHDVDRTEQVMATKLGFWRAPVLLGDETERLKASSYRPVDAAHFGARGGLPAGLLLQALIWHCEQGTMEVRCLEEDGQRGSSLEGSKWLTDGFDQWFLLAALFPRLAFSGVLTFLIWQRKSLSHWYMIDIEYVTWANSASEIIMSRKVITKESPWTELPEDNGLRIRPDTAMIWRKRRRIYEGYDFPKIDKEVLLFREFEGGVASLLEWAGENVRETWWVDFSPLLTASPAGAEAFLDRRYDQAHVAVCGSYFHTITKAVEEWAHAQDGLEPASWREGSIRKLPKLEGPMTLWKTDFSKIFNLALLRERGVVGAELLLSAWVEQGKAIVMNTTAGQMGWKLRL